MGLPNWLTILRILLIPVFVTLLVYHKWHPALIVFCLASFTDMLDGYIARTHRQQTRLGAFLDPVADKLLLISAFVTLTYLKLVPFWITAVVVSRDLILTLGVLVIHVSGGSVHPAPTWIGKTATGLQMATVLTAMVFMPRMPVVPWVVALVTALFTITSGLQYLIQGLKQLNPPAPVGHPRS
jgi:cardiolipin synthase